MKELFQPTNEQVRLAHQFEHALQSYFYTVDVIKEEGQDGMVFNTNVDGERTELYVDVNMKRGLQRAVGARFRDLKASGPLGKVIATDIVTFVNATRKKE